MEEQFRGFIKDRFGEAVIREDDFRGEQSFYIKPEALVEICRAFLEDNELQVRFLSDITAIDWLGHERENKGRFELIYNLYSLNRTLNSY